MPANTSNSNTATITPTPASTPTPPAAASVCEGCHATVGPHEMVQAKQRLAQASQRARSENDRRELTRLQRLPLCLACVKFLIEEGWL